MAKEKTAEAVVEDLNQELDEVLGETHTGIYQTDLSAEDTAGERTVVPMGKSREIAPTGPPSNDPLIILNEAIRMGRDVDTIRDLLAMRKELRSEWGEEQFFHALAEYQATYPEIKKAKAVMNKPKNNEPPTVRYYYAPLGVIINTVRGCLKENGFSFVIKPVDEEPAAITARVILHHKDGHSEESAFTAPIDSEAYMNAPQKVASARSFAKRQAFCDVTGTVPSGEDDDAQSFGIEDVMENTEGLDAIKKSEDETILRENYSFYYKAAKSDPARLLIKDAKDTRKAELAKEKR